MLDKIKCSLFGHKDDYSFLIDKADGKTYEVSYCIRCGKEIEKEVK